MKIETFIIKGQQILNKEIKDKKIIQKYINELASDIALYNREYYILNDSSISDEKYDLLLSILGKIEKLYPNLSSSDSPSFNLINTIDYNLSSIKHNYPMLSIQNAFNDKEIFDFDKKCIKFFKSKKIEYVCEPKIDGVSLALVYKNGKLKRAITRGDGVYGELVTKNINKFYNFNSTLKKKIDIEVRGECFIPKNIFNQWVRQKSNKRKIKNSRNIASGLIRAKNINLIKEHSFFFKHIQFYPYFICNSNKYNIKKQSEIFLYLKNIGFSFLDIHEVGGIKRCLNYYSNLNNNIEKYNFIMDGITIKINNLNMQKLIGYTSKFSKWSIAYKFKEQSKFTKIISYEITTGKTGKITYIANIEPIILDNTIISRVTLNNYNYIRDHIIGNNSLLEIKKSGGIIPKIINVKNLNNNINILHKALYCPSCKSVLSDVGGEQYCLKTECDAKIINTLIFFCSKNALDIQYLGVKQIEYLYKNNFIKNIEDLFLLKSKYNDIINIKSKKERKITPKILLKIISNIEESKKKSMAKFITGFSIKKVGSYRAKLLASHFVDIEDLFNCKIADIIILEGISNLTANIIVEYFNNIENQKMIKNLKKLGIKFINNDRKVVKNSILRNRSVVITGNLSITRKYLIEKIEKLGAKYKNTLSKKTDYLILGKNPGSKLDIAKKYKIKIISEDELINIIN